MAAMREIKRRRASIESTGQITKAMKLVATVRLQRVREKTESFKPYFSLMHETVQEMLRRSHGTRHPYLDVGDSKKRAIVAITSNRGLAGGYNANLVRLVANSGIPAGEAVVFAIGRKGRDALSKRGYEIAADESEILGEPRYSDAARIAEMLLDRFSKKEIGEIYLAYTAFQNTVSQIPTLMKLLPMERFGVEEPPKNRELLFVNYEPGEAEALETIIPKYLASLIYGALLEAAASENGARMTAMDSAVKNAEDMLEELSLKYNRARQGSITQELTEIIAGANAI